ncbi:glycosyltransferase, partial [Lacticaseibacillus paracasei subsp. paracasei Lpp126]
MLRKLRQSLSKIAFLTSSRDFILSIFYPLFRWRHRIPDYTVYTLQESSQKVFQENISLSRYGDGELRWLLGVPVTHSFQKNDEILSKRLTEVFKSRDLS